MAKVFKNKPAFKESKVLVTLQCPKGEHDVCSITLAKDKKTNENYLVLDYLVDVSTELCPDYELSETVVIDFLELEEIIYKHISPKSKFKKMQ